MPFNRLDNQLGSVLGYLQTDDQERFGAHNILHVQDQKAAGVAGGSFSSGAWRTRDLNTILRNTIPNALVALNQISLPVGNYFVEAMSLAFKVNYNFLRIQRISPDAATLLNGDGCYTADGMAVDTRAIVSGYFSLSAQSTIELQHLAQTTNASGFGANGTVNFSQAFNIFSDIKIWKLA